MMELNHSNINQRLRNENQRGASMEIELLSTNNLVFIVNSQQEYWRREFSGQIIEKNNSYRELVLSIISRGICPIFQIDNDSSELDFLKTLPENSIIIWCHADEQYDLHFNQKISNLDSVRLILRPYRLDKLSLFRIFRSIFQTIRNLKYASNLKFVLRVIRWQGRGFAMARRQSSIKKMYKANDKLFLNIPIGYTNIFAVSLLESFDVTESYSNTSLFKVSSKHITAFGHKAVTFSGQIGQVVRETAIKAAERIPVASITCRSSYGASNVFLPDVRKNGLEYVSTLRESVGVLCPPGNISGETFRIFETILMQRIPLAMNSVTSDPNYTLPFRHFGPWQKSYSWGALLTSALEADLGILEDLAKQNFIDFQEQIKELQNFLEENSQIKVN